MSVVPEHRHADDEDRRRRTRAGAGETREDFSREGGGDCGAVAEFSSAS